MTIIGFIVYYFLSLIFGKKTDLMNLAVDLMVLIESVPFKTWSNCFWANKHVNKWKLSYKANRTLIEDNGNGFGLFES